jgi:ABC-type transport system substrate-binding protein
VAAAPTPINPTAAGAVKRGGTATVLQTNDFVSMDPIFASGPTAAACYDWLLAWRPGADGTYGVQPLLAQAWETSADKIVFHLRDGASSTMAPISRPMWWPGT